eukprot:TRINITY_DN7505_c0_g1_i2.p3 TRINITY_DN7505_c0_g1~~TRINITY_DN7505_c0_g1_i2.p3  ORF type:complete len:135 (+),score=23.85 TRINITY_DN7505_c0_g1_i2:447-851(+)
MLEENRVVADCGIKTLEAEHLSNFNFRGSITLNRMVMQSEILKEALAELDWSGPVLRASLLTPMHLRCRSAEAVLVLFSPDPPHFHLSTSSVAGSCEVVYPRDSEVFVHFESQQTQQFRCVLRVVAKGEGEGER